MHNPNMAHWCRGVGPTPREIVSRKLRQRAVKRPNPGNNAERIRRCRARKLRKDTRYMKKANAIWHCVKTLREHVEVNRKRLQEHVRLRRYVKAGRGNYRHPKEGPGIYTPRIPPRDIRNFCEKIAYLPYQPSQSGWQFGFVTCLVRLPRKKAEFLILKQEDDFDFAKSKDRRRKDFIAVPVDYAWRAGDVNAAI